MSFNATIGDFNVLMDTKSPIGSDSAPSPKQLVLAAICGCTGMDVASLLKKYKLNPDFFEIEASATIGDGYPATFKEVNLKYHLKGALDLEKVKEAVYLSQSKYCGVSAMIAKCAPITYEIYLNGEKSASGEADFP